MKKINFYTIQKRLLEYFLSLSVLSFGFTLFFYYAIKNKVLLKKDIFRSIVINKQKLFTYNTELLLFRNIPLFYYILKGDIELVGLAKCQEKSCYELNENKIGLCSLWFVRKNNKIPNTSIYKCNNEYLKNRSFAYDFKILLKSLISLLYYKKINNYRSKIKIFDIEFDNLTRNEILKSVKNASDNKIKKSVYFVNADCLNKSQNNQEYKQILQKGDYILPDGSGINIACNILDNPLKENLNGTDLFPFICSLAQKQSYKIYLYGAKEGIAQKVKDELEKKYENLQIVGVHHGYVQNKDIPKLIQNINQSKADILFVALGASVQELFIEKYKKQIDAKLFFGVGGLFDFYSKSIKRAPLFIREIGFEWTFRMLQEPKRMWKRYIIGNPRFLYKVFQYKKSLNKNKLIDTYLRNYDQNNFQYRYKNILWKLKLNCSSLFKRFMDIFISSVMLFLLLPLFCLLGLIIRIESKGSVLFSQHRVGKKGKIFKMYKFRSMIIDASFLQAELVEKNESKDGVTFKMKEDPRITKVGKFIRKTSIDELPQLFNVLIGEMSLVGPRPPIQSEVEQYSIEDRKRLDIKPGITCIWQVSGRSEIPFKQQVIMDKKYIKEHGVLYDIILLLKTIPAVLFSKGSY